MSLYDRANMQRPTAYSYPGYPVQAPVAQKHYPTAHSTSSAFSASANPNEDWTKISDLAERRRIQNRIAQRNYRKKLKKRLEDLERRAGSSSASPEQKHEELALPESDPSDQATRPGVQRHRSSGHQVNRNRTPDVFPQQYVLPSEDKSMFSHQFTRQLSTSPPPFSYASLSNAEGVSYSSYPQTAAYCNGLPSSGVDMPMYAQYLPPIHHSYPSSMVTPPIKQEFYGDDEINPFSMSYASMAGIDVSAGHYQDAHTYANTPPLSNDSFDFSSQAGSLSPETTFPRTPQSMCTPPTEDSWI